MEKVIFTIGGAFMVLFALALAISFKEANENTLVASVFFGGTGMAFFLAKKVEEKCSLLWNRFKHS